MCKNSSFFFLLTKDIRPLSPQKRQPVDYFRQKPGVMKLFNVKWLQIYLACMHSFHSEPILGNLFLPWLGQGDPILGTSDFVDSLINQRRSQFQRSRRAKTGTPSYLSPPYPLAVFGAPERYGTRKRSRADFHPSAPPRNSSNIHLLLSHCPTASIHSYLARSSPLYHTEPASCPVPESRRKGVRLP